MNRSVRFCWSAAILLLGLAAADAASAADTASRSYPLPDHGTLQLQVPAAWKDRVEQPREDLPPTLVFGPESGGRFKVLMTPLWSPEGKPLPNPAGIKKLVRSLIAKAKIQSVEKTIGMQELRGSSGIGYCFSATDRAPKPGEFKFLTQGILVINDLLTTFTVLTNEGQGNVVSSALAMLKSAVHNPAGPALPGLSQFSIQIAEKGGQYALTVPVCRVVMTFPRERFVLSKRNIGGGTANPTYFMFSDDAAGILVSGWFEPAEKYPGAKVLWEEFLEGVANTGFPAPQEATFAEMGVWDVVLYSLRPPKSKSSAKVMPSMRAHCVMADTWIELHLSQTSSRAAGHEKLREWLGKVRVETKP